ncbi:Phenylalanine aminomutase (L-beta-phenylalanine forming), partial [Lachnellula subtilissima]
MRPSSTYEKFRDVTDAESSVESEDGDALLSGNPQKAIQASKFILRAFQLALLVSLICNAMFIFHVAFKQKREYDSVDQESPLTDFVELRTDILKPILELEESLYDPVWNSPQMSNELGIVALDQDFIKEKNLPQAMRYPWDESKNIYVISFHHSIHCLRYLRQSVLESHTGRNQSIELGHLSHCLNVLREDMFCYPDDTPRYTGRLHSQADSKHPAAGIDQNRKCRDFDKLFEWSNEHSACYTDVGDMDGDPKAYYKKDCI